MTVTAPLRAVEHCMGTVFSFDVRGEAVDEEAQARVLALFRLTFAADAPVKDRAAGHPVYLILAQSADRHLRLKPQNLVVGLPLAGQARAA